MNVDQQKGQEKGEKDKEEKEKLADSNESSMLSSGSMSLPSAKVGNLISRPTVDSLSYNPDSKLEQNFSCPPDWGFHCFTI